ncbi:MAG TPA: FHA domain-containing protein [Planctomycetota bacterium]|nr:FHA domain-containing protein [Planctomycetota bacterium]
MPERARRARAAAVLIGRSQPADVVIDDPAVSSRHARITYSAGAFLIQDLGSRNGVFLNGWQIAESEIMAGDEVRIGGTLIRVAARAAGEPSPFDETASRGIRLGDFEVGEQTMCAPRPAAKSVALGSLRPSSFGGLRAQPRHASGVADVLAQLGADPQAATILAALEDGLPRLFTRARSRLRRDAVGLDDVAAEAVATQRAILGVGGTIAAPVLHRGEVAAVIEVAPREGERLVQADLELAGILATHTALLIENAALLAELRLAVETSGGRPLPG